MSYQNFILRYAQTQQNVPNPGMTVPTFGAFTPPPTNTHKNTLPPTRNLHHFSAIPVC